MFLSLQIWHILVHARVDCDAPCFDQLKATHLRTSPKQQALLDVLLQLIKTWPLTIGPCKYQYHHLLQVISEIIEHSSIYEQNYKFYRSRYYLKPTIILKTLFLPVKFTSIDFVAVSVFILAQSFNASKEGVQLNPIKRRASRDRSLPIKFYDWIVKNSPNFFLSNRMRSHYYHQNRHFIVRPTQFLTPQVGGRGR